MGRKAKAVSLDAIRAELQALEEKKKAKAAHLRAIEQAERDARLTAVGQLAEQAGITLLDKAVLLAGFRSIAKQHAVTPPVPAATSDAEAAL